MKRKTPERFYRGMPCSIVAVGCAIRAGQNDLGRLKSSSLKGDYLSLNGMNSLIRENAKVVRRRNFKRGERPCLRDFCHNFDGKAVVCVLGHFVYVEGGDYWSFFHNGDDEVVSVWEIA